MIKIAFCDNDSSVLNELGDFLEKYRTDRNLEIEYAVFASSINLLNDIDRGVRFDIVFLDALMAGESGIDAAKEIRNFDNNVKIIFLTSSSKYAVESYTVGAFFYQLKPIFEKEFFRLMDSAVATFENEHTNSVVFCSKNGITRVRFKELEYCEVVHHTLFIHMTDGKVLECSGGLDDLCKQLEPFGGFLRIHRSYLINLEYVKKLSYQAVTMSSLTQLPIPRGKYQEIKDVYLGYMKKKHQVIM